MSIICESELRDHLFGVDIDKEIALADSENTKWLLWALQRLLYDDFYADHRDAFTDEKHIERQRKGIVYADEIYLGD